MGEVIHRFIIYVTKDTKGYARYSGVVKYCNKEGGAKVMVIYKGPVTRMGYEKYVEYIRLIFSNGIVVGSDLQASKVFMLNSGDCIVGDVEYSISSLLEDELDLPRLKLIKDGIMAIGGFAFDMVKVD